jgi:hypothetical protein
MLDNSNHNSDIEASVKVPETLASQETESASNDEKSFEEVRQLKESRDHALAHALLASETLKSDLEHMLDFDVTKEFSASNLNNKKYTGFAGMREAINDAMDIILNSASKRKARMEVINKMADPIRRNVKRILLATDTISTDLESAKKYNERLTDSSKLMEITIPNIDELKQLEAQALEIDNQLDAFEADAYKAVAREIADTIPVEKQSIGLKLAAETDQERSARVSENQAFKEAGW